MKDISFPVSGHRGTISRPVVATIAVVVHEGQVLLVRRANPPDAGRWGFPGGKIEFGETIKDCAVRELREETSVIAHAVRVITAVDALDSGDQGELLQHFVLVAVLCRWVHGAPVAGDDALEARWFKLDAFGSTELAFSIDVARVAQLAFRAAEEHA